MDEEAVNELPYQLSYSCSCPCSCQPMQLPSAHPCSCPPMQLPTNAVAHPAAAHPCSCQPMQLPTHAAAINYLFFPCPSLSRKWDLKRGWSLKICPCWLKLNNYYGKQQYENAFWTAGESLYDVCVFGWLRYVGYTPQQCLPLIDF